MRRVKYVTPIRWTSIEVERELEWMSASGSVPVTYRAKRADNGEWVESTCVYTTSDGKLYIAPRDTASCIGVDAKTGNIGSMISVDDPIFVEIDPDSLQWRMSA